MPQLQYRDSSVNGTVAPIQLFRKEMLNAAE